MSSVAKFSRYRQGAWSELMRDARGRLEDELASVVAYARGQELAAEAEGEVDDRKRELEKLEGKLPKLQAKVDELRVVTEQATDRYNAKLSRDPESIHGSRAAQEQKAAGDELRQAGRALREVTDRIVILKRDLAELEPAATGLAAIKRPSTPLLEELGIGGEK